MMGQLDEQPKLHQLVFDDLRSSDAASKAAFFAEFGDAENEFSVAVAAALDI
jgi:hypothetical protein